MLVFPDTVQTMSVSLESPEYDGEQSGTMAYIDISREPVYFLERSLENTSLRIWKDKTSGKGHNVTLNQD